MCHDIRTPLSLIKAPLDDLAEKEELSLEGKTKLDTAVRNTNSLYQLITNLINFEKAEIYSSRMHGETVRIDDLLKKQDIETENEIYLLVDRLVCDKSKDSISRLTDSVETAFYEGSENCILRFYLEEGPIVHSFSKKFEADGIVFEEPTDHM